MILLYVAQLSAYSKVPSPQPTSLTEALSLSSMSYSYSYSQSYSDCDYSSCSDEIIADINNRDQDRVCAHPDLSCVKDCISYVLLEAHCACNTSLLFDDFVHSFNFFGEPYCCGNDACKDAVLVLYLATYDDASALDNKTYALTKISHDAECVAFNCSALTAQPTSSPSMVCELTPAMILWWPLVDTQLFWHLIWTTIFYSTQRQFLAAILRLCLHHLRLRSMSL